MRLVAYCAYDGDSELTDFLNARTKVRLMGTSEELIDEYLDKICEIDGDIVVDLAELNNPLSRFDLPMNNEQIYDLFIRLQAVGDNTNQSRTLFIFGVNYPYKPSIDSPPLNKILCHPCVIERWQHDRIAVAYQVAKLKFKKEFLSKSEKYNKSLDRLLLSLSDNQTE